MGHDGMNARFAPFGGQTLNPDIFLASVLDEWGA